MKKVCTLLILTTMLLCSGIISSAASNIGVVIDQVPVQFNDSTGYPYIDKNGRTLVPLRAVMEAYGLQVDYGNGLITLHDPKDRKQDNRIVTLQVGAGSYHTTYFDVPTQRQYSYDVEMDTKAVETKGRTYVPSRALLEAFEAGVTWDKYRNQVVVRFDGTQAVIHEPYNDPAANKATSGRERFGGTIDQIGLEVSYMDIKFEESWDKDYWDKVPALKNVYVINSIITNRSGKNIYDNPKLVLCIYEKSTNKLIYKEETFTNPNFAKWADGEGMVWDTTTQGYDPNVHEVEILLAN